MKVFGGQSGSLLIVFLLGCDYQATQISPRPDGEEKSTTGAVPPPMVAGQEHPSSNPDWAAISARTDFYETLGNERNK